MHWNLKQTQFICILILLASVALGQTFNGNSTDKVKAYNCSLKINKDSSIIFIYNTDQNETFGEHEGIIKKLNDSLYHITANLTFGKFDNKRQYLYDTITHITNDTDYFYIAKPFVKSNDTVTIVYANKQSKKFTPYNNQGKLLFFALDKKLFSEKPGSNYYVIATKRKNGITQQMLTYKVQYGSTPSFESEQKEEFDVIIKNNMLWTTGKPPMQTRHFKLKKNSYS